MSRQTSLGSKSSAEDTSTVGARIRTTNGVGHARDITWRVVSSRSNGTPRRSHYLTCKDQTTTSKEGSKINTHVEDLCCGDKGLSDGHDAASWKISVVGLNNN